MNLRIGVLLVSLVGAFFVVAQAPQAEAADGYPYPDKPCIHAPYSKVGRCPNYDWGLRPGDGSTSSVISPYGYYYRNCTDYAAWKVSAQGVSPDRYKGLGDAKTWIARAPGKGIRVDGTPAAGSVAVRITGKFGHTAFVEEVRPDGTIRISQYNNNSDGTYSEAVGTPAQFGFVAFLHFEQFQTVPIAVPTPPPPNPALVVSPPVAPVPVQPVAETPQPAVEATPVVATESQKEPAPVQTEAKTQVLPETSEPTVTPAAPPSPKPAPQPAQPPPKPEGRGAPPGPPVTAKAPPLPLASLQHVPVEAATQQPAPKVEAPVLVSFLHAWSAVGLAGCLVAADLLVKRSLNRG